MVEGRLLAGYYVQCLPVRNAVVHSIDRTRDIGSLK